jgi:DNA-nicking Smr family endonuclease
MSGRRKDEVKRRFADTVTGVKPLDPGNQKIARPRPPAVAARRAGDMEDVPVKFVPHDDGEQAGFRAPDVPRERLRRLRRGEPPTDRELDLHGHRADSARRELKRALEEAAEAGVRVLRVVHGRGNHSSGPAVLRDEVLAALKQAPLAALVAACAPAPPGAGGAGATLVLLRRRPANPRT